MNKYRHSNYGHTYLFQNFKLFDRHVVTVHHYSNPVRCVS